MLSEKPMTRRMRLTMTPSTSGLPPKALRGWSSSRNASSSVLGAGKFQGFHWKILNAASQLAKSSTQMSRRLRLPVICSRFQGVDTIDLVLDFLAHQVHQLADLSRVDVPRVRQLDSDLAADASRVRVQHDDPVGQSDRLADRVRDEEYGLARLHPQFLELLVQQRAGLRIEGGERLVHEKH